MASEPDHNPGSNTIAGFPILATGKEQDQAFAARLTAILLGDDVTRNAKKCGFSPGVAYRLWKGDLAVEVLICFECDVLWPHVVGERSDHPHLEWQDFDSVRADLIKLAKEAFPDDKEILSLSSKYLNNVEQRQP